MRGKPGTSPRRASALWVATLLTVLLVGRGALDLHVDERLEAAGEHALAGSALVGDGGELDLAATHPAAPLHVEPSQAVEREAPCTACEQERRGVGGQPIASHPAERAVLLGILPPLVLAVAPAPVSLASPGRAPPSR